MVLAGVWGGGATGLYCVELVQRREPARETHNSAARRRRRRQARCRCVAPEGASISGKCGMEA